MRTRIAASRVPGAGLGVFAEDHFCKGYTVECGIVFPFKASDDVLFEHRLAWTEDEDAMASGNICLYNHSEDPNVEFFRVIEDRSIFVFALRCIDPGEELLVKYACKPWW